MFWFENLQEYETLGEYSVLEITRVIEIINNRGVLHDGEMYRVKNAYYSTTQEAMMIDLI